MNTGQFYRGIELPVKEIASQKSSVMCFFLSDFALSPVLVYAKSTVSEKDTFMYSVVLRSSKLLASNDFATSMN